MRLALPLPVIAWRAADTRSTKPTKPLWQSEKRAPNWEATRVPKTQLLRSKGLAYGASHHCPMAIQSGIDRMPNRDETSTTRRAVSVSRW